MHLSLRSLILVIPAMGLTLPSALVAQERDSDSEVIIVDGQRPVTVRELRDQASAITPTAGTRGQPLPRFHQEVCVGVWGLSVESARLVIDRINYNAGVIGLPVSNEEGCPANIIVVLTDDAEAEIAAMREEGHPLLRGLDLWERKRVARQDDGPVVVWNAISMVANNGTLALGNPPVVESTMMSRTMTSTYNEIGISVVMIDRDAVRQLDGVALADYVTMRALARTRRPVEDLTVDTILSLFDLGADGPQRLSPFDKAFLAGLYDSQANLPIRRAMGRIGSRMRQELANGE